jgi:hypothetical protein
MDTTLDNVAGHWLEISDSLLTTDGVSRCTRNLFAH